MEVVIKTLFSLELFLVVWIFLRSLGVISYKDEFSVRVTNITSRIGVSWTQRLPFCFWPFLTQWIMVILSKVCKPDNSEPAIKELFNGEELFNRPEVMYSASDKARLFTKNFSQNSNLDDSGISLPAFYSRTNLKLHISVNPRL